jgi:uncharacterized protein (DUF488 family)
MERPFFTIGHSNRSLEDFTRLLGAAEVDRVVDVRKMPGSRANPQFNRDALALTLPAAGLSYQHIAELGGLRTKTPGLSPGINNLWTNNSFHRYADYALTPPFRAGLDQLLDVGARQRCAVMCSEAVWWRCHRRIIADYLLAHCKTVFHIMGEGRLEPAKLTPGAVMQSDGTIHYPASHALDCC